MDSFVARTSTNDAVCTVNTQTKHLNERLDHPGSGSFTISDQVPPIPNHELCILRPGTNLNARPHVPSTPLQEWHQDIDNKIKNSNIPYKNQRDIYTAAGLRLVGLYPRFLASYDARYTSFQWATWSRCHRMWYELRW